MLVLTMSDDDVTVTKAMRAGARGYLLKGATKRRSCVPSQRSPTDKRSSGPQSPGGPTPASVRHPLTKIRFPS